MPTYLVRIKDTHDLVGIFSADTIHQLIIIIDECTEPDDCEYARLSVPGGIMWTSPAVPIPISAPNDMEVVETEPLPWSEATVTEQWWDCLHGYANCRWKRFFPDDPPKPKKVALPKTPERGQVMPFRRRSK